MATLVYTVIKNNSQYRKYCELVEKLTDYPKKTKAIQDEIELLTVLIEKYDLEHNSFKDADPIQLLKSLMKEHSLKSVNLAELLNVSEGLISDILNYKKGLSKNSIRILSEKFKLNQEAFNRPYEFQLNQQGKNTVKLNKSGRKRQPVN